MKLLPPKRAAPVAAVVALSASPTFGVPMLVFDVGDDGIAEAIIQDGEAGDLSSVEGRVIADFMSSNWNVSATGNTKPTLGSAARPELASTALTVSGEGVLAIYFGEIGFGPALGGTLPVQADLALTSISGVVSVEHHTFASMDNLSFPEFFASPGSPITSQNLAMLNAESQFGLVPFDVEMVPYSLVQKITITQGAGSDVQLTANLSASTSVPDGGSTAACLGLAWLGLAGIGRFAAMRGLA